MSRLPNRASYEGVLHIVQFNASKYLVAVVGLPAAAVAWRLVPLWGRVVLMVGVTPLLFWTVSSLIVSHYVYDRFPLYDFEPIARLLPRMPVRWINIHSGWDETSERLSEAFPGARGEAVDIFDPGLMTERSIRRAQRMSHSAITARPARYDQLPFAADTFDAAFSIFAAHELRRHEQRVRLLGEMARILSPSGEVVLMEHLRDGWNFLAFGPGFLHFFSQRAWRSAATQAGLNLHRELTMTPFVHVCFFRRNR